MLKSIINTTLRNIYRNKTFSLVNFFGLTVSMSLGLLIILIVKEQYTFDSFHKDIDRIYRVNTTAIRAEGGRDLYASAPLPIAKVLRDDYAFTEEVVRINNQLSGDIEFGEINVPISGFFVDPSFLTVFNFPLESGNSATALDGPNALVITQEAKKKIFGNSEALGKTVSVDEFGEFTVTGLLAAFPAKTHFDFEVLGSSTLLPGLEKKGVVLPSLDNWNNYETGYVYLKLRDGADVNMVSIALNGMAEKNYDASKLEARDKGYEFYLHQLDDITPGPELNNQMGRGLPSMLSYFFIILAGLVILMACFNYTNLMIAKSLSRAKEIGVRKAIGAQRWQVFFQFVGEAVIFSLFSLVISYILMQFLKPAFLQLHLTSEFSVDLQEDFSVYALFVFFSVGIGVIAGILPAIYLSAIKSVKVLKDAGNAKIYSKLTFRKILMVAQFSMSMIFIIVVLIIYKQASYMISKDYGFSDRDIVNVKLLGNDFGQLANEIQKLSGVKSIGGISDVPGTWDTHLGEYKRGNGDQAFAIRDYWVDENYLENIELQFIAGENFEFTPVGQMERNVILNESALFSFEFTSPENAIGQTIIADDSLELTVIGVVKDFHYRPLNSEIGPLAIRHNRQKIKYLSALMISGSNESTIAAIAGIWDAIDPVHPMELKMMEDEIDDAYVASGFVDLVKIVGYISFLAATIACLGMLAMAMYSTQTRIKEIGVRKVLGATSLQLIIVLSKSFLVLIGIAIFIGLPVGYFLGDTFISSYAYHIEITAWLALSGAVLLTLLGLITISSQTVAASRNNPINALRYE